MIDGSGAHQRFIRSFQISPTKAYIDLAGAAVIPEAYGHAFQGVIQLADGAQVMPFYAAHKATYQPDGTVDTTWSAAHPLAGGYIYPKGAEDQLWLATVTLR